MKKDVARGFRFDAEVYDRFRGACLTKRCTSRAFFEAAMKAYSAGELQMVDGALAHQGVGTASSVLTPATPVVKKAQELTPNQKKILDRRKEYFDRLSEDMQLLYREEEEKFRFQEITPSELKAYRIDAFFTGT